MKAETNLKGYLYQHLVDLEPFTYVKNGIKYQVEIKNVEWERDGDVLSMHFWVFKDGWPHITQQYKVSRLEIENTKGLTNCARWIEDKVNLALAISTGDATASSPTIEADNSRFGPSLKEMLEADGCMN